MRLQIALFGLAFATASPHGLTSPHTANSQAHSSKGTRSRRNAPTACRHTVSGTISLPSRVSHFFGLAFSAFSRHYLRNHCCFLFLWVLRCFTSPRSLLLPYVFRQG